MKYLLLLWILFSLPAEGIIWQGKDDYQSITKQLYVLQDDDRQLDIDAVSSGAYDSAFTLSEKHSLNFGFGESTYWLRFTFNNETSDSLLLELAHAFVPEAEFFYPTTSGTWQSVKSGYKVHLRDKVIKDHHQLFPLRAGNHTYYLRVVPYLHPIVVRVWEKNAYQLNANRQRMIYGTYSGILFFAIAINIFLFFALKKAYYLFYSILVFLYAAASAGVMEGYMIYFFPEADMMYWYKLIPVLNMPALLFYCLSFLDVRKASPKLYNFTLYSAVAIILYIIVLHFSPLLPFLLINQLLALAVFILAIYVGIVTGKRGNRLGYYFTTTYSIWFVLLCLEELYIQYGFPPHLFELSYVSTAIFVEAFLLAFLQAKRFQWERKEDEDAKYDLQRNIVEIKQRFQNEIMQAQLEMQEQTLRRISQEIHDNIGQTLSLVKINLNIVAGKFSPAESERLVDSRQLLSKAIHELRDLTKTMNTDYIKNIGLTAAVEHQVDLIRKTGKYAVHFTVDGQSEDYDHQKELLIFRIMQELFNNTIKHANGSQITVNMCYYSDRLVVRFEDNGVGFDIDNATRGKMRGLGLHNIINRTNLMGGSITFNHSTTGGSIIVLTVRK